jgi:hypothetical protein
MEDEIAFGLGLTKNWRAPGWQSYASKACRDGMDQIDGSFQGILSKMGNSGRLVSCWSTLHTRHVTEFLIHHARLRVKNFAKIARGKKKDLPIPHESAPPTTVALSRPTPADAAIPRGHADVPHASLVF